MLITKPHPDFLKRWKRLFFFIMALVPCSIGLMMVLDRIGYSATAEVLLWIAIPSIFTLFGYLAMLPYRVRCPSCGGKTAGKRWRAEAPDFFTAQCQSCSTIWDLGLRNSDT